MTTTPSAYVEEVTPEDAAAWLERNTRNRPIKPQIVRAYARDMKNNRWRVTGEAIKLDSDGNLVDGQHRLAAVVESGVPIATLVVRGVDSDAQMVMDSGAKRSVHDNLDIIGFKSTRILSAAARLALTEAGAGFTVDPKVAPTHTEIMEFIEAYEVELVSAVNRCNYYMPHVQLPPSVFVVCWMRFFEVDPDACHEFFDSIREQRTHGVGDPRLALARRLATARQQRSRFPSRIFLSLTFRAWNAWRSDRTLRTLGTHSQGVEVDIPSRLR